MFTQALPMRFQGREQRQVVCLVNTRFHQYDQIQSFQLELMMTEAFPYQSLDSVAIHGTSDMLLGHGQSQAGQILLFVSPRKHGEIPVRGSNGLLEYLFIILCR